MESQIRAVVFDMDGVLIDAREWHYQALNRALSIFGLEISRYDHLVTYDGLPTRKKLEMLSNEGKLPRSLHSFVSSLKQTFTVEQCLSYCRPRFIHEYALSSLKNEGYRLACCSNSIRESVALMLTRSGLIKYFDFFLCNEDVEVPKPDPAMYTKAIKMLDILPEQCLILEDNKHGIQAAKASGAHVMQIFSVEDTNYKKIKDYIQYVNGKKS